MSGKFLEFQPIARRRTWLRWATFFGRFVLVDYSLSYTRNISVGELLARLKPIDDQFSEAPLVISLCSHLKKYNSNRVVDGNLLSAWPI